MIDTSRIIDDVADTERLIIRTLFYELGITTETIGTHSTLAWRDGDTVNISMK